MKKKSSLRAIGRPRNIDKATAVLDAGWTLFLSRGIEATSIEAIAAAAGVSKVTLYSHFPDKAALFKAAVLREMQRIEQAQNVQSGPVEEMPVAEQLRRFGLGIIQFLMNKPATDYYTVIAGELRRHKTLAHAFYDLGPGRTRANLAALIETAVRRGELIELNPFHAADQLFGMWLGFMQYQLSLDVETAALREDLSARVERGILVFMKTYSSG